MIGRNKIDSTLYGHRLGKIVILIMVVYLLMSVTIPISFKCFIFERTTPANLSNSEWAGFLGSYAGGILGGFGTLIAVYFTVNSSMMIQEQNKKETDDRIADEYKRHQDEVATENKRRVLERKSDVEENSKRDRQLFSNTIAKELGVYITHITKYHYANIEADKIDIKLKLAKSELNKVENELHRMDEVYSHISADDNDTIIKVGLERDKLSNDKDRALRIYNDILTEQKNNSDFGNRIKANEAFFTINAMLYNVPQAKELLSKMASVHEKAGFKNSTEGQLEEWIGDATTELIKSYSEFKDHYILL